jgi:hypothetical protein
VLEGRGEDLGEMWQELTYCLLVSLVGHEDAQRPWVGLT